MPPPSTMTSGSRLLMTPASARAVDRLRQREAVGVILDAHLAPERALEVVLERPADEPGGVGVLDQARHARQRARNADADRAGADLLDQRHHRVEGRGVIAARRQHALAEHFAAAAIERPSLDLGPPELNPDPHGPCPK